MKNNEDENRACKGAGGANNHQRFRVSRFLGLAAAFFFPCLLAGWTGAGGSFSSFEVRLLPGLAASRTGM